MKTEKQLNNSIYLMDTIAKLYMKKHKLNEVQLTELDDKVQLLNYIAECTSVFDGLPPEEMLIEAEEYVNERI